MQRQKSQLIKRDARSSGISLLSIAFLLFITNPTQLPIAFILLLPMLVSYVVFVSTRLLLRIFFDLGDHQLKIASYTLAGGALFVLLLGSLKQLGIQDFVLTLLLAGGLGFYFLRTSQGAEA